MTYEQALLEIDAVYHRHEQNMTRAERLALSNAIIAFNKKQEDLEKAVEEILETRELELFWRRAAEQALRLWDQAQDEIERQKALVASACTLGDSLANMIDGNLAVARDAFEHYKFASVPEEEEEPPCADRV